MKPTQLLVAGLIGSGALLASGSALAQQKVDLAKSEIAFVSKQMGVPVDGRFRKFDAQIAFDPKKPETGKVAFTIDLASATISPDADAELPKAPWFNTAKFPQATFQSTAIKGAGAGRFDVAGKLVIKGSSRDVVVPVTLTQAGGATTAAGSFAIKRLDFKIGEGDWADTSMVANDVQVKFKLTLSGVGPL
ncbi:MAG TPA: YceI family protein [Burkholderiaceae bacterium]|nr:YceI family protein [Burkholderiaceae bacterium]HMX10831.1 YceI family protein [Burkholderiaceae bacterium]HMZ01683.1 YceI family protein [Burkholderiaceae bacterium]HNB47214.1 YceI family protein [Burkholderiaceae bacterium]HNG81445.1 YceI family protein [Burkholderiaceae bacterium]